VHEDAVRALMVGIGVLTAFVGAAMAVVQSHLKRLLAFSTVTYAGLFLIGFAMFDVRALAGTALFILAHAFLKGALFMCAGVLLHRSGSVDIVALTSLGRTEPLVGLLFVLAGIGLVGLPPFGTFVGKELIEEAASNVHYGWVVIVFVVASGISAAAGLRAAARVFLGWEPGAPPAGELDTHEHYETVEARTRTPLVMLLPIVVLVVLGMGVGLAPGLASGAEHAAARFTDSTRYAAAVIDGASVPATVSSPESIGVSAGAVAAGILTTLVAVGLALVLIERRRLPANLVSGVRTVGQPALGRLRALHSGHIGDYIAWLTVGVATFGGILAAVIR
jgi:multicomponent Na+:H+ antiporter subunit D